MAMLRLWPQPCAPREAPWTCAGPVRVRVGARARARVRVRVRVRVGGWVRRGGSDRSRQPPRTRAPVITVRARARSRARARARARVGVRVRVRVGALLVQLVRLAAEQSLVLGRDGATDGLRAVRRLRLVGHVCGELEPAGHQLLPELAPLFRRWAVGLRRKDCGGSWRRARRLVGRARARRE